MSREKQVDMTETDAVMSLTSPATEIGTRKALARVMERLADQMSPERAGMVEIALAEVINNIVEHAYRGQVGGMIRLSARLGHAFLRFEICDDGSPLPGGTLPPGRPADLSVPRGNLPEGGFGWLLIHSVAREVRYSRNGEVNQLVVVFDLGEARPKAQR